MIWGVFPLFLEIPTSWSFVFSSVEHSPITLSKDDWGVQSPPKRIVFWFRYHSQNVVGLLVCSWATFHVQKSNFKCVWKNKRSLFQHIQFVFFFGAFFWDSCVTFSENSKPYVSFKKTAQITFGGQTPFKTHGSLMNVFFFDEVTSYSKTKLFTKWETWTKPCWHSIESWLFQRYPYTVMVYYPSLPNTLWVGVWTPKHLLRRPLGAPNTSWEGIWRILKD